MGTTNPLKILYVCSELAPFVSTGGLGEVAAALPRALAAQGHDVRIALPCYAAIPDQLRGHQYGLCVAELGAKTSWGALRIATVPKSTIPLYLIEHEQYFGRPHLYGDGAYEYDDNAERYCFFCLAVLHGIAQTGWRPDIVHCHDWHTAPIPAYIKTRLALTEAWRGMPVLLTIHNLAYQGRYKAHFLPYTGLGPELFTPDCLEYYGDINFMKAGIAFASKINTVSPRYAKEIQTPQFGEGLDGFLRTRTNSLSGILNGVDYNRWNPAADPHIAATYSAENLAGKADCKADLQKIAGLPQRDVPLIGMVSRLHWQKGIDLLAHAIDAIMLEDIQLVILGTGNPYFEEILAKAAQRYTGRMCVIRKYDDPLAHQIEAGSDFFLMPSHYEPCGLSQLYSLAYGTIPIVRETGGLADSVRHITKTAVQRAMREAAQKKGPQPDNKGATGIVFKARTPGALAESVHQAVRLYQNPETLHAIRLAGMNQDFSWERSSKAYVKLYRQAIAKP